MRTRSRWRPGGRCYGSSKRESWCKQRIRSKPEARDRKSTRLNSSHRQISYAVFCLKKNNYHITVGPIECIAVGDAAVTYPASMFFVNATPDQLIHALRAHHLPAQHVSISYTCLSVM